jgi:TolB-like protein/DNA-binding winged helix-turn-helix (wHTH) protein/tetratricopeptide (TPR) repeat protein
MHLSPGVRVFRFGVFELDSESGELRRHGLKVRLPDQSFQILRALLLHPGEVVTREELQKILWPGETFVDFEVGLNSAVRKLREALDDSAENPRFIETVPRRGYRFVGPVISPVDVPISAAPPADDPAPAQVAPEPVAASDVAVVPPGDPLPLPVASGSRWRLARESAIALLFVMLIGIAGLASVGGLRWPRRSAELEPPIASIVVLPFENLTGDPAQEYLADSVTEAIATQLSHLKGVNVISRTSARQYKQTLKPLSQIRAELNNVEGVVEGTVRRSGDKVWITARLIRAETDRTVAGPQTYEGEMSGMFILHQQIASDLAAAAGQPRPEPAGVQTIAPKAADAFIKGVTARGLQRHEGFRRAVGYFEEAIAIQPDFAEAYAELAMVQVQFLYGGPYSPHQIIPKAEAAARKALQLDDNQAKAHRALGQILNLYYWRWEEGDKELERATVIGGLDDPPEAVSASLRRRGRVQEAIAAAERARKFDPLSVQAQIAVGNSYRAAGQYDRAMNEYRRALEMSPGNNRVQFQIGVNLVAMGRPADAIRDLEFASRQATGHNSRMEAYLGYAYAVAGRRRDAREVLKELEDHRKDQYVSWYGIALIHDALGEKAPALAALQRAFEDRAVEFGLHDNYAPFRTIASEPAFQSIVRQVGR